MQPGQWTDDTSMALCLAESLITTATFDPADQMSRYLRWYLSGHMSSTGRCFDIGNTVRYALHEFQRTGEPFFRAEQTLCRRATAQSCDWHLFHYDGRIRRWKRSRRSGESSRTTHGTRAAVDGCRYLAALIVGAVLGIEKSVLLSDRYSPVPDSWVQRTAGEGN